jgi:phosphatidylglycerol---prolipoprotein diacylglyceryl transferase
LRIPTAANYVGAFPYYVNLWHRRVHPHLMFEAIAYVIATASFLLLRRRFGDPLNASIRWTVVAAAVVGAAVGSRILFLFEDPSLTRQNLHDPAYLLGGKTIVGALVFGLAAVEIMKGYLGVSQSTGDLYAIPLALGIAIGRVGCFLTGLADNTFGVSTGLPWGVDFGDGVRRHPTQLYETLFLLLLIPVLYEILKSIRQPAAFSGMARALWQPGDDFRFFMIAYLLFRLLCDFLKPYPRLLLQLNTLQWACVLCLLYYSRDVGRWLKALRAQLGRAGAKGVS